MSKTKRNLPYWAEEKVRNGDYYCPWQCHGWQYTDLHEDVDGNGRLRGWLDASLKPQTRRFYKKHTSRLRRRRMGRDEYFVARREADAEAFRNTMLRVAEDHLRLAEKALAKIGG